MVSGHSELIWSSPLAGFSIIAHSACRQGARAIWSLYAVKALCFPTMASDKNHCSGWVTRVMDRWHLPTCLCLEQRYLAGAKQLVAYGSQTWSLCKDTEMVMDLPAPEQCCP